MFCGSEWQPTVIKRLIEVLPTSTNVAKVSTDNGNGFLKGMGNPAGNEALAAELVSAELARWFGLRTAPFAILDVQEIEIPVRRGYLEFGPAFITKQIPGLTGDGADVLLRKLNTHADVCRLVIFDTWIRNSDRCSSFDGEQIISRDNLFFSPRDGKLDLVALDHSHCWVETTLEDELGDPRLASDETVYGYFPEFEPYMNSQAVAAAVNRLRQLDIEFAREVVNSIPAQWGPNPGCRQLWSDLIFERAQKVAAFIPLKLVGSPELEL
jgi:hypothetical protein